MTARTTMGCLLDGSERRAAAMRAAAVLRSGVRPTALVGFDGFLDVILRAVDARASMRTDDYVPIATIESFGARIGAAAGRSANVELVEVERRFGGNGPLLAGALGAMGAGVTYIGCVGAESMERGPGPVHGAFEAFAARCERVLAVAPPGVTHALEFGDGKIMFNMPGEIQAVTWESIKRDLGQEAVREAVRGASLIGIVNWSIMAGVETLLAGVGGTLEELSREGAGRKRVFVDLSDPAKRTRPDLRRGLGLVAGLQARADVTLGLNLSEATQVAHAIDVLTPGGAGGGAEAVARTCIGLAESIRERLGVGCVVVHPREGGGGAAAGESTWIDGPMVATPRLSTGAGDHFNAGFAFAQCVGCDLGACLAMGVGLSGAYVRDAASPSARRLAEFLDDLPGPELASW
jgi:hypothetical protein